MCLWPSCHSLLGIDNGSLHWRAHHSFGKPSKMSNDARGLLRGFFCELTTTAFTPLYCTLVRPHLEYAMEANVSTLRADINQLEFVQRLATRLVRGLRHVTYDDRLRQTQPLLTGTQTPPS